MDPRRAEVALLDEEPADAVDDAAAGALKLRSDRPIVLGTMTLRVCSLVAPIALALAGLLAGSAPAFAADRDCSDFVYQEDAQAYFISRGGPSQDPDRLDGDHDGQACDSLPHRGSSPSPTQPPPAPAPDADGDGVADQNDACTYEPGTQANGCPAPPPRKREVMRAARITAVIDGDTVKARLANGKRVTVRLIGIDTPETNKPGVAVECGGPQATANMRRLAFKKGRGRSVTLTTDPSQDRTDRYGRLLAYARVDSGRDLGLEQIRAGWSTAYVYAVPFERLNSYRAAEGAAKSAMRGGWNACAGDFHSAQ